MMTGLQTKQYVISRSHKRALQELFLAIIVATYYVLAIKWVMNYFIYDL